MHIYSLLKRILSDVSFYHLRSIKRKLQGRPPLYLPYTFETQLGRIPSRWMTVSKLGSQLKRVPILQEVALEKYDSRQIAAPYLIFNEDEVLVMLATEIAKALTLSVAYINSADVKGDIVEFGTMGGFTARTIATAMVFDPRRQPNNPLRKLHLFDSFQGLPDIISTIDIESPHVISGTWSKGGCKVLGENELSEMVSGIIPKERFRIYPGWFSETVIKLPKDIRFAMIHFDGDLYQSTIDALEPCFANGYISPGAVFLFDDWNCNHADPACGERRAWAELVEKFNIKASFSGDYSELGSKLIVHSYDGIVFE